MKRILPGAWRRLFRLPRADATAAVDDEIAFHMEMRVADYVARGMSEADARRRVLERFGDVGVVRDECVQIDKRSARTMRRAEFFQEFGQDVRFAGRTILRSPGFAIIAAFTLALGTGATTAVFSVVHGVLLSPLPYREPDRLVMLWSRRSRCYSPPPGSTG